MHPLGPVASATFRVNQFDLAGIPVPVEASAIPKLVAFLDARPDGWWPGNGHGNGFYGEPGRELEITLYDKRGAVLETLGADERVMRVDAVYPNYFTRSFESGWTFRQLSDVLTSGRGGTVGPLAVPTAPHH